MSLSGGGASADASSVESVEETSLASPNSIPQSVGIPVFKTVSGELLAPVGGVVLVLRSSWRREEVDSFLEQEGLADTATPLGRIPNAYTVHTAPGMAAVELANRLASMDGVRIAAPNWWRDLRAR